MAPLSHADLFGLPTILSRPRVVELISALEGSWGDQFDGSYPIDLAADLHRLVGYFDPLAREATVRRRLDSLQTSEITLPEGLGLSFGSGKQVVTPEGRVALEVLRDLLETAGPTLTIDSGVLASAQATVADFYRALSRRRLDKVQALAAGDAPPMLPVSAAFVLMLLINRSTSRERSLAQGGSDTDQRSVIDGAIAPALRAFAEVLTGEKFQGRDASLGGLSVYQGYAVTEARRRLGSRLRLEEGRLWIPEEDEDSVLDFIARELKRRAPEERALAAFDALVDNYRTALPAVANLQFAHERPANTAQIRRRLGQLMRDA